MNMNACHPQKQDMATAIVCAVFLVYALGAVGEVGRERAKRLVCLRNLEQLTLAWSCYADDNNGRIVNGAAGFSNRTMGWGDHTDELAWVDAVATDWDSAAQGIQDGALWPYLKDVKIYRCPMWRRGEPQNYSIVFSMNAVCHPEVQGIGGAHVKRKSEIRNPSLRLVFVDEGRITSDAFAAYYSQEKWWDLPSVRHNDGSTLSFADGHVEYWTWRSLETVAVAEVDPPVFHYAPATCEALEDLYRMQIGVWGRLGYAPSCGLTEGERHD